MQVKVNNDINQNHIVLWFLNFDFQHNEIAEILNLQPTRIATKGQELIKPNGVKNISKLTFWEYEWRYEGNDFIGDAVERFVDEIIKPRTEQIRMLANKIDAEFKIVQYYYDGCNPGYHFTTRTMQILVAANLELDIDAYYLHGDE